MPNRKPASVIAGGMTVGRPQREESAQPLPLFDSPRAKHGGSAARKSRMKDRLTVKGIV